MHRGKKFERVYTHPSQLITISFQAKKYQLTELLFLKPDHVQ